MNVLNPWKSYRQVATQTAPPAQLVLMLYEGAVRFLEQALEGFSKQDPAEFNMTVNNNLHRAQDVIRELNRCLNMDDGGECAANFRRLYEYLDRRLVECNLRKQPEAIREVIGRLTVLRDAWAAMLCKQNLHSTAPEFVGLGQPAFA